MVQNILKLLLLVLQIINMKCLNYIFRRTNILEKAESWENNLIPCENDQINFDENKIITAFFADGLNSQKINLPTNGILFFGEKMKFRQRSNWKCKRKQNPKEVYFKQSPSLGYHNGSNWMVSENEIQWRPILHVLQVPSSQDSAIIPADSGTQILLEDFVTVGKLIIADQVMNNDTFNELFLRSIEGQFQFQLSPKLKSLRNILGIDYQWPKFSNTVAILDETIEQNVAGQFNSNLESKKMALICSYQQCQPISKCSKMFQPIGHCCNICGSMFRFRAAGFNFNKFQKQVRNYKLDNEIVKEYDLDIASLRIDQNDLLPQYQIVVLAQEDTKRPFNEQIYFGVLNDLVAFVQNNFDDHLLAIILLFAISAVIIGAILAIKKKFDFTNFRSLLNQNPIYEAVYWRNSRSENELQLLRNDESTLPTFTNNTEHLMQSEPEYSSTFENIAFDEEIINNIEEK